jgi:hypothetical protein
LHGGMGLRGRLSWGVGTISKVGKLIHHIYRRLRAIYRQHQLKRYVSKVVKHGTVRDIRDLAALFRQAAADLNSPGALKVADKLESEAERIVMRRVFNDEIYYD